MTRPAEQQLTTAKGLWALLTARIEEAIAAGSTPDPGRYEQRAKWEDRIRALGGTIPSEDPQ